MATKLPTLPANGEGVIRYCAEASDLIKRGADVPHEVSRFAASLLNEVYEIIGRNMDAESAERLTGRISNHVLGTTLK